MEPTLINGIPAHPLLVHAVVVLLPLAALCLVACAAWPPIMRRFGLALPALALVALVFVPLTTTRESGWRKGSRRRRSWRNTRSSAMGCFRGRSASS